MEGRERRVSKEAYSDAYEAFKDLISKLNEGVMQRGFACACQKKPIQMHKRPIQMHKRPIGPD